MHICRRAIAYFRRDLWLILGVIVLVGLSFAIGLIQAWPIPVLLDTVFSSTPRHDWIHRLILAPLPQSAAGRIIGIAILGMLLKLLQDCTWFLGRVMLNNRIRYNGLARVRLDLYDKLQHLSLDYHRARPQGDAIYRLSTDTLGFFGILDTMIGAGIACLTMVAMACIMFSRSVPLTLCALSITPLLVLANVYFAGTIKRQAFEAKQAESDFTTSVQRSMGAVGLIQAFCRQAREFARFRRSVETANSANWRLNWQEALYPLTVQTIFGLGTALIFGYGGYLAYRDTYVLHKPDGLTIGDLLAFMAYLAALCDPLARITGFRAAIQNHATAAARVFAVLDTPVTVADAPDAMALAPASRTVTLQNVTFAYPGTAPGTPPVLRGITAQVAPGELVAFVGPSGTGKSTLLSLLTRFYDPDAGSVLLDGYDLRSVRLADVRRHVALVSQDSATFPGTVAENIAFGRPEATLAEIRSAAEAAGAAEFIEKLPGGYEAPVTEGGANFSGGQRQRLAIARALLAGAPVLVFDEPTSAQDPEHERQILATLTSLRGSHTIILVTHRLESVVDCDQIFVLDEGRVAERGTYAQLMARQGRFYSLATAATMPASTDLTSAA